MKNNGINDQATENEGEFIEVDESALDDREEEDQYPEPQLSPEDSAVMSEDDEAEESAADEVEYELHIEGPFKSSFLQSLKPGELKMPSKKKVALITLSLVAFVAAIAGANIYNNQTSPIESTTNESTNGDWSDDDWLNDEFWLDEEHSASGAINENPGSQTIAQRDESTAGASNGQSNYESETDEQHDGIEALVLSLTDQLNEESKRQDERIELLGRRLNAIVRQTRDSGLQMDYNDEVEYIRQMRQQVDRMADEIEALKALVEENKKAAQQAQDQAARSTASRATAIRPVRGDEIRVKSATEGYVELERVSDRGHVTLRVGSPLRGWGAVTRITPLGCIEVGSNQIEPIGGEC